MEWGTNLKMTHQSKFYLTLKDGVVITTEMFMVTLPDGTSLIFLEQFNSKDPEEKQVLMIDPDQLDLITESFTNLQNTINNVN